MIDPLNAPPADARICKLCRYARRMFVIAWGHSAIFMIVSLSLGGTTVIGKVVGDQHYLGDHGRYTPVSKTVYELMGAYEGLALTVFVIGFAAAMLSNLLPQCRSVPKRWWG